jgi:RimJ/RimL family protein N-acetyltransferase
MIIDDLREELTDYNIVKISKDNIQDVFKLMQSNPYFYEKTQFHSLTIEECLEDITALPPNTDLEQKTYIAFYEKDEIVAVLDYIEKYPDQNTVYIGFFMLHMNKHGKNIGRQIINHFIEACINNNYKEIKLACFEPNEIGYRFWSKMGFTVEKITDREVDGRILKLLEMKNVL